MRLASALVLVLASGLASGLEWQRSAVQRRDVPISASSPSSSKELYPLPAGFQIEPPLDMSQPPRTQGAKYVKIRQGPYQVAANTTRPGEFIIVLEKPCKSCFITAIQGGLEFEDGTPAHVNHGAVLQHLTIYNGNVRDLVCQSWKIALPNRVYATGNEREVARVNPGGSKFGLNMTPDDWYSSRFEIMNEGSKNMTVYVTQTYEILEKTAPEAEGYRNATTAWIDVAGCGGSLFTPDEGTWDIKSFEWESTINGTLLFSTGHVHDGALDTTLYLNYVPVCVSSQLYGRKPQYVDSTTGISHISDNGVCTNLGEITEGDFLHMTTRYDSTIHPYQKGMVGSGFEPIMAINNIYIGLY